MSGEQILRDLVSEKLSNALGDKIVSISYSDGEKLSDVIEGAKERKFLQRFTVVDEERNYFFLSRVVDNPKSDKKYVYLGEIGTILDFSIPRGAFITSSFQMPEYHSLANIDDTATTPTATPLKMLIETEINAKKDSAFVELFQKIPDQARGPDRAFFERGKLSVKFADEAVNIDTEPSISIVPRKNRTLVVVRFLALGNWSKNEKVEYEYEDSKKKTKKSKIEIALQSEQVIVDAFKLLQHTMKILEKLRVDTEHTSQLTGGLVNYLAFESARREYKPADDITFLDFLQYTPTVSEIVIAMGANTARNYVNSGFETVPILWAPMANMNYDGKEYLKVHYRYTR